VEFSPLGFGQDKFHFVQFNYFKYQFIDSFMLNNFWAAGMALVTIFEIQLRVILTNCNHLDNNTVQRKDLGQLIDEFKVAYDDKKIILTAEAYGQICKALNFFNKSRNFYLAHNYPNTLKNKLEKQFQKKYDPFCVTEAWAPTALLSDFYYNEINELLSAYVRFHSLMENHYRQIYPKIVEKNEGNKK
jgi:hypothetical protein